MHSNTTLSNNNSLSSIDAQTLSTFRVPEISSTEIVHSLFGPAVGPCWGDFSCSYHRQHGRLYASSKAVLFYSNLFGFERRLCMMLSDVDGIALYRTTSIRITMVDGEVFVFKSLVDREFVVKLLEDLKKALEPPPTMSTKTTNESELQTMQVASQPPPETSSLVETKSEDEKENNNNPPRKKPESKPALPPLQEVHTPPTTRYSRASSEPHLGPSRRDHQDEPPTPHRLVFPAVSAPDSNSETVPPKRKALSSVDVSEISSTTSENLQDTWSEMKNSSQPTFKETVIDGLCINCSLDEFFDAFLADDAPHSMKKYQEENIGDKDFVVSLWKTEIGSRNVEDAMVRTMKFKHRVARGTLGFGPSSVKTTRQQTLRRYGDLGMFLESSTRIEGIPASDCFFVDDRWTLETKKAGLIALTVQQETRFTKTTMLKGFIQKSTKAEVKEWYDGYKRMVLDACPSRAIDKLGSPRSASIVPTPEKAFGMSQYQVTFLGLAMLVVALLVVGQFLLLRAQLAEVRRDMLTTQSQMDDLSGIIVRLKDELVQSNNRPPYCTDGL